jgi:plastocyanin
VRLLAAALVAAILAADASAGTTPPSRVQVSAREFSFSLSRQSVKAGPAVIELVNFGQDPHDLRLQRIGGAHIAGTPQVDPGQHFDLTVKLLPGKYNLWCSIANHRALGMQATLTVRKR